MSEYDASRSGAGSAMHAVARHESEVRSYSRAWPTVFSGAKGHLLFGDDGREYLDFFSAAGSLNYGHNHPDLKLALLEYLAADPVIQGLDTITPERGRFLDAMATLICEPRGLDYRVQFCGPTGTNAVEAALKLARKVTGRTGIVSFTSAYHGLTLGALAATGGAGYRAAAGVPLTGATPMPYDGYLGPDVDTIAMLDTYLSDSSSGLDLPAAVLVETLQAEGGINVASPGWLRSLADVCKRHGVLLVVDDIQVGCGRTGGFFSFEQAGIVPDIVCLSKSISGYGMPMAINLIKPELDQWKPGDHTGTFRGFGPAIAIALAALERFWSDTELMDRTNRLGAQLGAALDGIAAAHPDAITAVRGRVMIRGIEFADPDHAASVARTAFANGLIVETCGNRGQVVKLLPSLVIPEDALSAGLDVLAQSIDAVCPSRETTEAGV